MRFYKLFFLVVAAVILFQLNAAADESAEPVKWSQLPRMDAYGYDFSSEFFEGVIDSKVADDFLCKSELPVIDLHWWGSYWEPGALYPYHTSDNFPDPTTADNKPPDILIKFNIEFYKDVPAGVDPYMPWSHPGELLYEESIPIQLVSESLYGTVTHIGGIEENVWQYNADLPRPFEQTPETIYWLKIQAVHSSETIQWGWHESVEPFWQDNAVQMDFGREGKWELLPNKEMAFELSVVPEPTSIFLLLPGFGLLVLLLKRRSKK